eukprot:366008-Chlamydomonas_euryale.AAC.10
MATHPGGTWQPGRAAGSARSCTSSACAPSRWPDGPASPARMSAGGVRAVGRLNDKLSSGGGHAVGRAGKCVGSGRRMQLGQHTTVCSQIGHAVGRANDSAGSGGTFRKTRVGLALLCGGSCLR